jgi:murein DD-endopeptidase MepM/ murein hydrolase activator NlpD
VFGSQRILNKVPKRPHYGLDVAAPTGTPVRAPAPGIVTLTHADMFYTGGTVVLDHGHGLSSIFMHLSRIDAKEGDRIEQGQLVGAIGATGRATGPHLHWGLYWFGTPIDPRLLLPTPNPPRLDKN